MFQNKIMKLLKNKKIIFVDYFDTLVFRCVNSYDVQIKWAETLKNKYTELNNYSAKQILDKRNEIKYSLRNNYEEVPYAVLMEKLAKEFSITQNVKNFVEYNKSVEESIELGVQFVNNDVLNMLKQAKKMGKKIYLLSDFYLPKESYIKFLTHLGVSDIFDDIFVSEQLNLTKRRNGAKLYNYVIKTLNCNCDDVVMIGDNYESDFEMCKQVNISSYLYTKKNKKTFSHLNLSATKFNKKFLTFKINNWENKPLTEYAILFYLFTKYLYNEAKADNVKTLTFLSRDGYFLKTLFEEYQNLVVKNNDIIKTNYCYNSRLINQELNTNKNYEKYLRGFVSNNYLNIVDCGWNNSAQEKITSSLNIKTRGYYIGTFSKNKVEGDCKRTGLIYDITETKQTSPYYWLLRTNFTIVEQLLMAPHGSLISFGTKPELDWPATEKELYFNYVQPLQQEILKEFKTLVVWLNADSKNSELQFLAKFNVKAGLLANNEKLELINKFSANYYDNFSNNKNLAGDKNFKNKKPILKDKLFYPEKRLSILVKKQRKIKGKIKMCCYKIWAKCFIAKLYVLGKFKKLK